MPDTPPAKLPSDGGNVERGNIETDGTFHQSQLGFKARKKHLFAPLDPLYADAVHRDAAVVEYTQEEERQVKWKIDRNILPLVLFSHAFAQFNRNNIGNAHVFKAFNDNFGISSNNKWTLALSIFYVGNCLVEIPANILQRRMGSNRFFFFALIFWGIASLSFVYARGFAALLVLRHVGKVPLNSLSLLVTTAEYSSELVRLDMNLPRESGSALPGIFGGLVAFGVVRAHTSILAGWQFLFLIEAIPTLVMAVAILLFLPSFPFTATFLTPRERAIAQARLNRDHKPQSHGGMTGWQGFKAILIDPNAWLLALILASCNVGAITVPYFLPTLIKGLGFSAINAQGLTVAPYAVGFLIVQFQAWHSDRTRDRGWHIMLSCSLSVIGYVILAALVQKSVGGAYFALFLIVGGNFCIYPLVMSWAANTFSPTSKRGVGTAFILSIGSAISVASPQIFFDPEDSFRKGIAISAA
ncbi:MFS general substrate transporter [Lyophyllum atratum]|nr:MFS general substrate transporter [Lyophyllum atratum]